MTTQGDIPRFETGIRNLDALVHGGLPKQSVIVIGGPPGAGKTILTEQICFHNGSAETRILYFSTLSEPTAKTLRYLKPFSFFDPAKLDHCIQFIDLGVILRSKGLEETSKLIMEHVRRVKPAIVVLDSFKVFDDLAKSQEEIRKFVYELVIQLMAWEVTVLLLGEFSPTDIATSPLFSIIDGLIVVTQREQSGEQQRFLQIVKMRGTVHSRDEHPFLITSMGIEVFAPRVTIQREPGADQREPPRLSTGIGKLDDLLADGIPLGSSLLIGGVAGTGKTVLLLEFIYRGAQKGEKGIIFSFEETPERLRSAARGLGWDFDRELEQGMIEIVFIPQPEIMVEGHLLMMQERVRKMGAARVAIDSVSVFLHKVKDPQIAREKVFQLASIVQNAQAVGFFATDIPYGTQQISRFGVEETVVDGVILLSATEEGFDRQRYLEVYKLRNTAHLKGRHNMSIGEGGISIFPRYREPDGRSPPPSVEISRRLPSGVEGLDALLGGGFLERSATLVSGSAGVGKTTFGLQFVLEGATREQPGLCVGLEEGPEQLVATAEALGLPLAKAVEEGRVELLYLSHQHIRANQFLSLIEDRIRAKGVRRLVFDSVSHVATEGIPESELKQILFALVARTKALGVTSLFTLEAVSLFSAENATERAFSPISDNLLVMRYERTAGENRPYLQIVKTRGSAHDRGAFELEVGSKGLRIGPRLDQLPADRTGQP
jgi:circadian clock protein KaiC